MPDQNAQPLYQVWRRPKDSKKAWEKVPGLEPMPKHEAFRAALEQDWVVSLTDWEYDLYPVGQVPRAGRPFYAGYQTKVMKPR